MILSNAYFELGLRSSLIYLRGLFVRFLYSKTIAVLYCFRPFLTFSTKFYLCSDVFLVALVKLTFLTLLELGIFFILFFYFNYGIKNNTLLRILIKMKIGMKNHIKLASAAEERKEDNSP